MRINVAGLLKESVGQTRSYEITGETLVSDWDKFDSVRAPVRMLRTDQGILVEAEVAGATRETCSRCLRPVTIEVTATVEEEFYPTNTFDGLMAVPGLEADGGSAFAIDEKNILVLSEAMRQALVSAAPLAPMCGVGCQGICPHCAADRNVDPCECQEHPGAQWSKLQELNL